MTFNFAFYLSLVLAAMGCAGLLLAGRGKWYGWGIGLAVQPVWATYAIVTKGYGLLITCLMYGTVNGRNLWKWYQEKHKDFNYNRIAGYDPTNVLYDEHTAFVSKDGSEGFPRKNWWR